MSVHGSRLRSLYRSFLRELPPRPLSDPSPVQQRIRAQLLATSAENSDVAAKSAESQLDDAAQFLAYVRAQHNYAALLERYNPGMNMTDEERVRLTMRRVGMEMPEEVPPRSKQ